MIGPVRRSRLAIRAMVLLVALTVMSPAGAQQPATVPVTAVDLPVGRSLPIRTIANVTRISIVDPAVVDAIVISENEVVINSLKSGETDAILWLADGTRIHYRISVHSPSDRMQIAIGVKFAEVRRNAVRNLGLSGLWRDNGTRIGTGIFNTDNVFDDKGVINLPATSRFVTILSDLGTDNLLAFLDAEEQRGNARLLAEPNILAGNKDSASFLAGGELPIPIIQPTTGGAQSAGITIQYREFGIRLSFVGEIISDSLIKLSVTPEVSSLDFANAITIQGFRIPALRTRRISSTLDVKRDQSLIISGMFANEEERTKTGVPFIKDIPIIGELFSSSQFQKNESELLVIVTPVIVDPMRPRGRDVLRFPPDTTRPATDALKVRVPPPATPPVRRPPD